MAAVEAVIVGVSADEKGGGPEGAVEVVGVGEVESCGGEEELVEDVVHGPEAGSAGDLEEDSEGAAVVGEVNGGVSGEPVHELAESLPVWASSVGHAAWGVGWSGVLVTTRPCAGGWR